MGRMRSNLVGKRKRSGLILSLTIGALLISSILVVFSGCTTELIDTINKMVDFHNRTDKVVSSFFTTNPTHGETNVYRNRKITVTFDETMDAETINNSSFTLSDGLQDVKGTVTYVEAFNMAVFAPASTLFASNQYTATLTRDMRDLIGNRLEGGYAWFFTTGTDIDTANPSVIPGSELPLKGTPDAVINTKIAMEFSEPLDPTTINASTIQISPNPEAESLSETSGSFSYDDSNNTVVYSPGSNLQFGTEYTVRVTSGVKDLAGLPLEPEYEWSFIAGAQPDFDPPILLDWNPQNLDITVGIDSNADQSIYIEFNEPINAATLNIQSFSLRKNGQPVIGEVQYDSDIFRAVYVLLPEVDAKLSFITQYTITIAGTIEDMAGNQLGTGKSLTFVTVASGNWLDDALVDVVKVGLGPKEGLLTAYMDFTNELGAMLPGLTKYHIVDYGERINADVGSYRMIKNTELSIGTARQYKSIVLLVDTNVNMLEYNYWDDYLEILRKFIDSLGDQDQIMLVTFASPEKDKPIITPLPKEGFANKEVIFELLAKLEPSKYPVVHLYDAIGMGAEVLYKLNSDPMRGVSTVISMTCVDPDMLFEYNYTLGDCIDKIYTDWGIPTYSIALDPATETSGDLEKLGKLTSGYYGPARDTEELAKKYSEVLELLDSTLLTRYTVIWESKGRLGDVIDIGITLEYPTDTEGVYAAKDELINYRIE